MENLRRLEARLKLLQKYGVTSYKEEGIELCIHYNPPAEQKSASEIPTEALAPREQELPMSMSMWGNNYHG